MIEETEEQGDDEEIEEQKAVSLETEDDDQLEKQDESKVSCLVICKHLICIKYALFNIIMHLISLCLSYCWEWSDSIVSFSKQQSNPLKLGLSLVIIARI